MSKQSLLLVDGDTRSLRVLEVSLRKAGFMVTAASSVQDALDKLELRAPDLIISETTFPDGDGFELRRRVRGTPDWAEIPFIFLTAEAAIENKIRGLELGVDDYLTKPIYIKEIVTRINILLQKRQRVRFEERRDGRTRFTGRVHDMPVVDVIQTIEISRKSGVIQFVGERGRQAAIYFRDGRVIDAEAGALQGEDAVYRLLTWSEGEFEVVFRTVRRREVITMSSQALLMEGMRRLDEWSRLFEQLPPLTHRFEVDTIELAARLGDVPDDNNRILRLFDGKRALLEVIDASDVGDLECLQAISRLYFEELLLDLDHGKTPRRDTGKALPLVEADAPTPIEEVASGPTAHDAEDARVWGEPRRPQTGDLPVVEDDATKAFGDRQRGLDDAETGADDDRGLDQLGAEPAMSSASEPDPAERGLEGDEVAEDDEAGEEEVGPLMGGYRPSSLRLIDEAVAAAQAIEPSLFDELLDEQLRTPEEHAGNGVARTPTPPGLEAPRPDELEAGRPAALESAAHLRAAEREESGLRMIGSLGRDRAEASGELAPLGRTRPLRSETARELVTILPRRITRELPVVSQELAESLPTPTPTSPVLAPRPSTPQDSQPLPVARPSQRISLPGSGVTSAGRSRGLLRMARSDEGGPGLGPLLLILLAIVLAGTAVMLRLRRHASAPQRMEELRDAGHASAQPPAAPSTADVSAGIDARARTPAPRGTTPAQAEPGPGTQLGRGRLGPGRAESAAGDKVVERSGPHTRAPLAGNDAATQSVGEEEVAAAQAGAGGPAAAGGKLAAGGKAGVDGSVVEGDSAAASDAVARAGAPVDKTVARDEAKAAVRAVAQDKAAEAKALYDKAHDALEEGDAARAFAQAEASLRLRKTARTYLLRAQAEQRLERVDAALASVGAAAQLAPQFAAVWELRGRILWAARRREEARDAFAKFLALEPNNPRAAGVRRLMNEPR